MDSSTNASEEDNSIDNESNMSITNNDIASADSQNATEPSESIASNTLAQVNNTNEEIWDHESSNLDWGPTDSPVEPENITELVVLDPEHPLMTRFQTALKDMLTKKVTTVELKEKELIETTKKQSAQLMEVGTFVYGEQEELAQFQSKLTEMQNELDNAKIKRKEKEKELQLAKLDTIECKKSFETEYLKMNHFRNDLDNVSLRLFYLRKAQSDMKGDVAIMKRASEKAVEDLDKAERDKMDQDIIVDRMMTEADKLREDIDLLEAQLVAQEDEKCAVKQTLHEAASEIQTVITERKKIHTHWNSTLLDLTRRNEALTNLNAVLSEMREQILVKENEIDGLRRSIRERQELNEKLMLILKKSKLDHANVKKQIDKLINQAELLNEQYEKKILILNEMDEMLGKVTEEKNTELAISNSYESDVQYLTKTKHEYEERIDEELRTKMTTDSAKALTNKLVKTTRDQTRELESKLVLLDHKLGKDALKVAELKTEIAELDKQQVHLNNEINEANSIMNKLENEKHKNVISINNRQTLIDQLNKKYSELFKDRGGVALGPLEATIHHLNRTISETTDESSNLEQTWLRQQHEIIQLHEVKAKLNEDIEELKQKCLLLEQRKLRYSGYIDMEEKDRRDIEKELKDIQHTMLRINTMIDKEGKSRQFREHDLGISRSDLELELKEEEKATIELQTKMDEMDRERNLCVQNILEIQSQIMTYEKKMSMLDEAKKTVKSEMGQREILNMKSEIHRMELRHRLMKQQQEMLIQDMERGVNKRDITMTRKDSLDKMPDKVSTKSDMDKVIAKDERKLSEIQEEQDENDSKQSNLEEDLRSLGHSLDDQNKMLEGLHTQIKNCEIQTIAYEEEKYELLMELQRTQKICKLVSAMKTFKNTKGTSCDPLLNGNKEKCREQIRDLMTIAESLMADFPEAHQNLHATHGILMKSYNQLN